MQGKMISQKLGKHRIPTPSSYQNSFRTTEDMESEVSDFPNGRHHAKATLQASKFYQTIKFQIILIPDKIFQGTGRKKIISNLSLYVLKHDTQARTQHSGKGSYFICEHRDKILDQTAATEFLKNKHGNTSCLVNLPQECKLASLWKIG